RHTRSKRDWSSDVCSSDLATPMGRAMLYIVAVFAQLERETIAQRVRDNYYARLREGSVGGGPAPFGFRLQKIRRTGRLQTIYAPDRKSTRLNSSHVSISYA